MMLLIILPKIQLIMEMRKKIRDFNVQGGLNCSLNFDRYLYIAGKLTVIYVNWNITEVIRIRIGHNSQQIEHIKILLSPLVWYFALITLLLAWLGVLKFAHMWSHPHFLVFRTLLGTTKIFFHQIKIVRN